jgi:coenzyme F420-reducing hydrogenase alpha subunit
MAERSVYIQVPSLARVEGEGALDLVIENDRIERLQLRIYEPPRLFERFLLGRSYEEVPDMVARICGICPVAYQLTAVGAIEDAFGLSPEPWVHHMRRVLYCGEWIQSHALHIHLLAAPDFFGCDSVVELARSHGDVVRRGLMLQGLGNDLMRMLGARSVHPVGVRVGGFHHAPSEAAAAEMHARLRDALPQALELVDWVAGIEVPGDDQDFTQVTVRHDTDYPLHQGRIVSSAGLDIAAGEFEAHFAEQQVEHSTALWCLHQGEPYLVGPLARVNLCLEQLPGWLRERLPPGISWPSRNMFHSMLARAIEIAYALGEAARLLEDYRRPREPWTPVTPREGEGFGATEAPRGLLWHGYRTDGAGLIRHARIVPPTSQNQARVERDLHASLLAFGLDRDDDDLRLHCEKVVRNYDPCISCATHFLTLNTERR